MKALLGVEVAGDWNTAQCKQWADRHPRYEWNSSSKCGAAKRSSFDLGAHAAKRLLEGEPKWPQNRKGPFSEQDALDYKNGVLSVVKPV